MPALRCLIPLGIKMGNGGLRKSLLRFPKRPLFRHLQIGADSVLHWFCPIGYEDETGFHFGEPGHRSEDGGRGGKGKGVVHVHILCDAKHRRASRLGLQVLSKPDDPPSPSLPPSCCAVAGQNGGTGDTGTIRKEIPAKGSFKPAATRAHGRHRCGRPAGPSRSLPWPPSKCVRRMW